MILQIRKLRHGVINKLPEVTVLISPRAFIRLFHTIPIKHSNENHSNCIVEFFKCPRQVNSFSKVT